MGTLSQGTVLLNGGNDVDVVPVEGSDQYLLKILGELPAKPAVPTLCVLDNTNGDSFVAVYVADKHVGYLPHPADPELIRTIRECNQSGAIARARGKLIASWEAPDRVKVRVSLSEPSQLLAPRMGSRAPDYEEELRSRGSSVKVTEDMAWQNRRAWADAMPQSAKTAQSGWLGADARAACSANAVSPMAAEGGAGADAQLDTAHLGDPWYTPGERRTDHEQEWAGH